MSWRRRKQRLRELVRKRDSVKGRMFFRVPVAQEPINLRLFNPFSASCIFKFFLPEPILFIEQS